MSKQGFLGQFVKFTLKWGSAGVGIYVGGLYISIHHKHTCFHNSSVGPVFLIDVNKCVADYVFKQKSKYE